MIKYDPFATAIDLLRLVEPVKSSLFGICELNL